MGKQTCSFNSDESGSDNDNADIENEDVSEEDDPSEEDPLEEDQVEDEPQEVNSCEEPEEDAYVPNEYNSHEQELDEVASHEEEPSEIDSRGSPREDGNTGKLNEESYEEDKQCEEKMRNEESCEEEPYEEDEQCEEEMRNEEPYKEHELCEEDESDEEDEKCEEVMIEEEEEACEELEENRQCEEKLVEEEPCEEPGEPSEEELDEEAGDDEEPEEELSQDPVEESNEEYLFSQFYNRKDEKSIQSNSKKMKISSDTAPELQTISKTSGSHNTPNNLTVPVKPDTAASTGKKRQSKWDVKNEANKLAEHGHNACTEKRKSRCSDDDPQTILVSPLKNPAIEIDLEIPKLYNQLFHINKRLHSRFFYDQPQGERSPSPPPIYNNLGIQINTREARVRSKLMIQKQAIISELIQKNPNFKPPPDYKKNCKLVKSISIPLKKYPGYNIVGLILGAQKKLEETGARIKITSSDSKLDKKSQAEPGPSANKVLNVRIEADNQYSLDVAVATVEKLLIPVDDGHDKDKLSRLRESADMGGNLKEIYTSNPNNPDTRNACGDTRHPTSSCSLIAPVLGANSNGQMENSVEMGSGLSPFNAQPPLSVCMVPSMNNSTSQGQKENIAEMASGLSPFNAQPALSVCTVPSGNNSTSHACRPKKVIDDANLYVGYLPQSVDDNKLIELFAPFGPLSRVSVIRDRSTNISKGYGYVMYADPISAAKAVAQMDGVKIDGKVLAVRIAGIRPPNSHIDQLPSYPGTSVIAQKNPHPMRWPGPPESRLPGTDASLSNNPVHHNPFGGQYLGSVGPSFQNPAPSSPFSGNFVTSNELARFPGYLGSVGPSFQNPAPNSPFSGNFVASNELAQFPGYLGSVGPSLQNPAPNSPSSGNFVTSNELAQFPGYLKSLDSPQLHHPAMPSSNLPSSQVHFTHNFGGYQMPPT